MDSQEPVSLFQYHQGAVEHTQVLQWATYHYMIVNMACADAHKSESWEEGRVKHGGMKTN